MQTKVPEIDKSFVSLGDVDDGQGPPLHDGHLLLTNLVRFSFSFPYQILDLWRLLSHRISLTSFWIKSYDFFQNFILAYSSSSSPESKQQIFTYLKQPKSQSNLIRQSKVDSN